MVQNVSDENKVPTSFIIPTKSNFKSSKIQNKPNKGIIETNKSKQMSCKSNKM